VTQLLVAIGAARHLPADLHLDLGELHPTQQGGMQISLTVADGRIVAADPRIGFVHRSAERLFEARDYRQLMMLANRHDWVSAFSSELAIALVLEEAMGIIPPERATWSRMLLAEMNRLTAVLLMLGTSAPDSVDLLRGRERYLALLEQLTGSRIHPMFNRIGGIACAADEPWLDEVAALIAEDQVRLADLPQRARRAFDHLAGIGVITAEQVRDYGLSGALAQASGLPLDLRVLQPYLAYAEVMTAADVPVGIEGDIPARFAMLAAQARLSLRIMDAATHWLLQAGPGAFDVPLPKVVRAPELTSYGAIEGSLGSTGVLLDSIGERSPWRLKLRTPAFATVQSLQSTLIGLPVEQLVPMVQSCAFMIGDADR